MQKRCKLGLLLNLEIW